jgi:hypothetical protein
MFSLPLAVQESAGHQGKASMTRIPEDWLIKFYGNH